MQSRRTLLRSAATTIDPWSVVTVVSSDDRLYAVMMAVTADEMLSPVCEAVPKWRTARAAC